MMSRFSLALGLSAWAVVLVFVAGAFGQAQVDPFVDPVNGVRRVDPGWHALVGGTVHVRPGEVIEGGTVVVRDGVIVEVVAGAADEGEGEDTARRAVPPGARVWDCRGLHVYAGLIDPWVEVGTPRPDAADPGAHWNERVTPQRRALDGAGIDGATAKQLREMGFAAAGMSPEGGIFRGRGAVVSLAAAGDPIEGSGPEARRRVYLEDAYQAVGFDTRGPGGERGYPNSQGGAIALVRQTLSDAAYYGGDHGSESRATRSRATGDSNCLLWLWGGGKQHRSTTAERQMGSGPVLVFDVDNELEVLRANRIAKEFGRAAVIVGSGLEFRRLDAIAEDGTPLIVPLNFPEAPKVASVGDAEAADLRELMTWEQAPTNARRLVRAGVKVALTTSKLEKRGEFRANVRKAIAHGLTEEEALAAVTTTPALLLGVEEVLGTIERGKIANLVVTDGSLFAKEGVIRDVWIDGQRHEVNAAPPVDLSGTWVVTAEGVNDGSESRATGALTMVVKHEARKRGREGTPKITLKETATDEKGEEKVATSEGKNVVLSGDSLTFTFEHDPFGAAGVFVSSGVIEGWHGSPSRERRGPLTIRFDGMRSNGEMFRWVAQRETSQEGAATPPQGEREATEDHGSESRGTDVPEEYGYPFGAYAMMELPAQRAVIFRHATIWTCGPEGVVEDGAMAIDGGKILWVVPDDGRAFASDGEFIDARGKHITPGLIDCHSHTGLFSGGVNESGQAVTAEVRMGDITNPDTISWYRQLAGGITAANQLHGSANPIGGQSQTVKNRWGVKRPEEMHFEGAKPGIKFALGENVKQSNGSRAQTRYPSTRMGVETLMRDRFTAAREYAAAIAAYSPLSQRVDEVEAEARRLAAAGNGMATVTRTLTTAAPPRRDLELEALAEILAGERLVHCHSYRQDEILMLCRVAGDFGFRIGTFQHILEGYKVAGAIRENAIGASSFSDWWAYKVEVQDAIPFNGAIMHDVGVNVSFNSDSDELARRMNAEAGKAIKYGDLPPEEALKFVTLNPAIQMGIDDRVGSLEPGKDADFVIWSGDPLSSMTRAEATWVDGREYFSLEQDRAHREKIAAERARIIQKILGAKKGGQEEADDEPALTPEPEDRPIVDTPPEHWIVRQQRDAVREHFMELLRRGHTLESAVCGDCGCTLEMMR